MQPVSLPASPGPRPPPWPTEAPLLPSHPGENPKLLGPESLGSPEITDLLLEQC